MIRPWGFSAPARMNFCFIPFPLLICLGLHKSSGLPESSVCSSNRPEETWGVFSTPESGALCSAAAWAPGLFLGTGAGLLWSLLSL